MISINTMPNMKCIRTKLYMPKNTKNPSQGSIIFINNKSFEESMELINHPMLIKTSSNFYRYYMDLRYKEKIGIRTVNIMYKRERMQFYEELTDKNRMIKTPMNFSMVGNKNVYFDLFPYNDIYFKNINRLPLKRRIDSYFNYLKRRIEDSRFSEYNLKHVFMNVDEWTVDSTNTLNNPIMFLFILYKKFFDDFKSLGDINFILYTDKLFMKINPSMCNKNEFSIFRRELQKLLKTVNITDDEAIEGEISKDELKNDISNSLVNRYSFTGEDNEDVGLDTEIPEVISDKVSDEVETMSTEDSDKKKEEIEEKIKTKIENDEEVLNQLHTTIQKKKVGKSAASLKRDEELRKKQKSIKIANRTIDDYLSVDTTEFEIPSNDVSNKIATTNEHVKNVKFSNFEKSYNETLFKSDTVKILQNLNDKSIPAYIVSMDITDSSDELNYKDTYRVVLEDENRVRHTLNFDVPKFVDDKFLYINGNKKFIMKQLYSKPITKTGPDEVQICSNYNKIFIRRHGNKMSPKVEKLKKVLATQTKGIIVQNGDASSINNKYKTSLEYDELSKNYISIKTSAIEVMFNQKDVEARLGDYKLKDNEFCIGFYNNKKPIIGDYTTGKVEGKEIVDFIIDNSSPEFVKVYEETSGGGKRFMYSKATIMAKDVPLILLLSYCEGLETVMTKANIKHYFTDKRPKVTDDEGVIQFEDGYLVYDRYPIENSLLMNALALIPTKAFNYDDMNEKDVYVELFGELYNARNLSNAFDSFYEFMIDPITKEVLEDLDYPTDFVNVILFGNALLADNSYITENNMNLYRVRSNEVINGIIHKELADAYSTYRATSANNNPVKISIPKDAIIKRVLTLNTVEEFSSLNPIYESEKLRSITVRGLNGMNQTESFTEDKRAYDKSMVGLIGMSTSPDANVGVIRKLTLEPSVKGPRGYIEINEDASKSDDVNLFTAAELLTPMGVTHDDSNRTAMSSKQSGHIMPVKNASPVLVSNGVEQTIQYNLSKDFVIVAEEDGEVVESDEQTGIVMVKYKSGKCQAIDTQPKVLKNSSSGFYIANRLNTDLKKGDKVKKNDIIGYEDKFFRNDGHNGNRFNLGSLQKIAVMSAYSTYEDSTFTTKKMSEEMATEIVMKSDVVIGRNSNVDKIVKIGDQVQVGDVLVQFDTSYDDESINKFLASVGDDLKEEVKSLSKVPIKAKYSGEIVDIKIYSAVDVKELSPSLQKIVKEYYGKINKKKTILEKYDKEGSVVKAGILFNESTGKVQATPDGKIKGQEVLDGVLFEFYIKYDDPLGVGDKLTFYSALKAIVGEVIEEGYEPYSEFRPDEEISSFVGPSSIMARMVPSALIVMFTNKVLVELKRKLKDIYEN